MPTPRAIPKGLVIAMAPSGARRRSRGRRRCRDCLAGRDVRRTRSTRRPWERSSDRIIVLICQPHEFRVHSGRARSEALNEACHDPRHRPREQARTDIRIPRRLNQIPPGGEWHGSLPHIADEETLTRVRYGIISNLKNKVTFVMQGLEWVFELLARDVRCAPAAKNGPNARRLPTPDCDKMLWSEAP